MSTNVVSYRELDSFSVTDFWCDYIHTDTHVNFYSILVCHGMAEFFSSRKRFHLNRVQAITEILEAVLHPPTAVWMMKTHTEIRSGAQGMLSPSQPRAARRLQEARNFTSNYASQSFTFIHILTVNTDQSHTFPNLSSVRPRDSSIGTRSTHHQGQRNALLVRV